MHLELILTLTGGLAAALVLGYITHRLKLSPIVGYLVAGVIIGPHTPGFVADVSLAEQLAEVGVILLMFGVGLQFHLEELLAVKRVAIPGAVVQSLVAAALGAAVTIAFGWSTAAGIVFGLAIAVASTVVLVRVLSDNDAIHTPAGHIAVGWLVVEDIFTVLVLVILPTAVGGAAGGLPVAIAITFVEIAALVVATALFGKLLLPRLLERVAATRSRELFTLSVLVIALGIAVGAAKLFGVSMALGAFLAGMIVGRSEFSSRAAAEAMPMREAFAVLFFVSVGMLLDPRFVLEQPGLVAAVLAIVVIVKPLAALGIVLLFRKPLGTALVVAVALGQIGEFSFILATLGRQLDVLPPEATQALVAASILSITLNPLLFKLIRPVERWSARRSKAAAPSAASQRIEGEQDRAVVVGYGPVGQTVTRLLRENGIPVTVIDLNLESVRGQRELGHRAVYGDASRASVLAEAGVSEAMFLILSSGSIASSDEVIRAAREMNPRVRILARTTYLREAGALRAAGAQEVFAGEGELALALTTAILSRLGASPDQIDRERDRVRAEVGEASAGPAPSPPPP